MTEEDEAVLRKLNPIERKVLDNYMLTGKRRQSALDAGYAPNAASKEANRLLNRPDISKIMQERMDDRSERVDIKADFVLQGIKSLILRCEKGAPVYKKDGTLRMVQNPDNPDGELIYQYRPDTAGALRGYELLGKHLKLFTEHHEITHTGEVQVSHTVEAIGFDEIKLLAARKKAEKIEQEKVISEQ